MNDDSFSIKSKEISSNFPPYIIAEISANHNGSLSRAKDTILAAKKSGVDAVKIQTYTPETMTIESDNPDFFINDGLWKDKSLFELYGEAFTPFEWHSELFLFAKKNGITMFSSPFDETAVDLLESLDTPAYKVASFEIVDLPLIRYIASKNKPMLMSTGMASLDEVGDAIECAKSAGNNNIALFHCISNYPASIEESNLNSIQILRKEFSVQVGLSDHTVGNLASIVATSLGASMIEKHFTLNRLDGGVDSSFSNEPDEMKSLVEETKKVFSALGSDSFARSSAEQSNKIFRRSLYFVEDINEGEFITVKNVRRIRPGFGLEAKFYDDVIGAECLKSAKKGDRVTLEHFSKD